VAAGWSGASGWSQAEGDGADEAVLAEMQLFVGQYDPSIRLVIAYETGLVTPSGPGGLE
jgi:hypothetical protein